MKEMDEEEVLECMVDVLNTRCETTITNSSTPTATRVYSFALPTDDVARERRRRERERRKEKEEEELCLQSLPYDVLAIVASMLDPRDRISAGLTCQKLHEACLIDPSPWRRLCVRSLLRSTSQKAHPLPLLEGMVDAQWRPLGAVRELDLGWVGRLSDDVVAAIVEATLASPPGLSSLSLDGGQVSLKETVATLLGSHPKPGSLTSLNLSRTFVDAEDVVALMASFPRLRRLSLQHTSFFKSLPLPGLPPHTLTHLILDGIHTSLSTLARSLSPSLTTLSLVSACVWDDTEAADADVDGDGDGDLGVWGWEGVFSRVPGLTTLLCDRMEEGIGDAFFVALGSSLLLQSSLLRLSLARTGVSDTHLSLLSQSLVSSSPAGSLLPPLSSLDLSYSSVSSQAIADHIFPLFPSLCRDPQHLSLSWCPNAKTSRPRT